MSRKELHQKEFSGRVGCGFVFRAGMGLRFDAVIVSAHRDFAAYDRFQKLIHQSTAERVLDLGTFLVDLDDEKDSMPFTLSLLADKIQTTNPQLSNLVVFLRLSETR